MTIRIDEIHRGLVRKLKWQKTLTGRASGRYSQLRRERDEMTAMLASALGYRSVNRYADYSELVLRVMKIRTSLRQSALDLKKWRDEHPEHRDGTTIVLDLLDDAGVPCSDEKAVELVRDLKRAGWLPPLDAPETDESRYAEHPGHPLAGVPETALQAARHVLRTAVDDGTLYPPFDGDATESVADAVVAAALPGIRRVDSVR